MMNSAASLLSIGIFAMLSCVLGYDAFDSKLAYNADLFIYFHSTIIV